MRVFEYAYFKQICGQLSVAPGDLGFSVNYLLNEFVFVIRCVFEHRLFTLSVCFTMSKGMLVFL